MRSPVAVPPGWRVTTVAMTALFEPRGQAANLRGFTGAIQALKVMK